MYSVSVEGKWTTDGKSTKSFFESKGCIVNPSRRVGDFDIFIDSKKVGVIFNSQSDQLAYLKTIGKIS